MKSFIKCSLAIAVLAASVSTAQAKTDMVVVSWGGAYTKSQTKAYHEPYMKLNPESILSMMIPLLKLHQKCVLRQKLAK